MISSLKFAGISENFDARYLSSIGRFTSLVRRSIHDTASFSYWTVHVWVTGTEAGLGLTGGQPDDDDDDEELDDEEVEPPLVAFMSTYCMVHVRVTGTETGLGLTVERPDDDDDEELDDKEVEPALVVFMLILQRFLWREKLSDLMLPLQWGQVISAWEYGIVLWCTISHFG